jgi:hypothetical protein
MKHEIARRIEELDSGKVKTIPWAEARRQITALLSLDIHPSALAELKSSIN